MSPAGRNSRLPSVRGLVILVDQYKGAGGLRLDRVGAVGVHATQPAGVDWEHLGQLPACSTFQRASSRIIAAPPAQVSATFRRGAAWLSQKQGRGERI